MNFKIETLNIAGMSVEVIRKKVKRVRLGIYPPEGRVKVTAPLRFSNQIILTFITENFEWIRKHRENILTRITQPEFNYVSGENHYLFGKQYNLQVFKHTGSRAKVMHYENTIEMHVPDSFSKLQREDHLNRWYREQLKIALPAMFKKCSLILGVNVNQWMIKKMKTRWGSCNIKTKRISISLELAKHSHRCIEYVVCHELAHILEPSHNQRFKCIMTAAIPDWKLANAELKHISRH